MTVGLVEFVTTYRPPLLDARSFSAAAGIEWIESAALARNNPIQFGVWRSLVAHLLWEQGVGGSNPLTPTNFALRLHRRFPSRRRSTTTKQFAPLRARSSVDRAPAF
jgi:hypothetical protein